MIEYKQLSQKRENSINAVSVYSPSAGEQVQVSLKIVNTSSAVATVRIFHDDNGTTYNESTVIGGWDLVIAPGQLLEINKIFMNNSNGNLAYRSSVANALTATVYGIIK